MDAERNVCKPCTCSVKLTIARTVYIAPEWGRTCVQHETRSPACLSSFHSIKHPLSSVRQVSTNIGRPCLRPKWAFPSLIATTLSSTRAPFGRAVDAMKCWGTSMVDSTFCSAMKCLQASAMRHGLAEGCTNQVASTINCNPLFSAFSTAIVFISARSVCDFSSVPQSSMVSGTKAIWPERKIKWPLSIC